MTSQLALSLGQTVPKFQARNPKILTKMCLYSPKKALKSQKSVKIEPSQLLYWFEKVTDHVTNRYTMDSLRLFYMQKFKTFCSGQLLEWNFLSDLYVSGWRQTWLFR